MAAALDGLIVLDLTTHLSGPFCGMQLADMGADVIKIESPQGDSIRGAPPFVEGEGAPFMLWNRNKRGIVLDLKAADDLEIFWDLVDGADVVLENFRPGVMGRFGLDYASVRELQPRVVYCSVSGYGQSSPRRDWPAIDNIVQATSGMMSLSGENGDGPMRVGFPVVDTLTGQTAAFAIVAALLRRERTGCGEHIDVAMFDAAIAFMTSAVVPYLVTGKALERTGNIGYSGQPTSAVFETSDGRQISLGVVQQAQFELLARALNCERWLTDPRFATPDLRRQNSREMRGELVQVFATQPASAWERQLSAAGVPCGMVRDVSEAVSLQGLDERGIRIPLNVPGLPDREDVEIVNAGFKFSQDSPHIDQPPPRAGEHGEAILQSLGFDADERREILAGNPR